MTTARIEPAGPRDVAMHREQYDRLVGELQELGFDAEIELWEQRGALDIASHIIIHLGEFGATAKGLSDLVPVTPNPPWAAASSIRRAAGGCDLRAE